MIKPGQEVKLFGVIIRRRDRFDWKSFWITFSFIAVPTLSWSLYEFFTS